MNIEPALKALAAALHGEGPAVELSAGPDGSPVLGFPDTTGIEDAAVVVRTSGSTGAPKATVLTVEALAADRVLVIGDGHIQEEIRLGRRADHSAAQLITRLAKVGL